MLERMADGDPGWAHGERWVERMCSWAGACERVVVNAPRG